MTIKRSGLGRNLSALLSHTDLTVVHATPSFDTRELDVNALQPGKYQPRLDMDETSLEELSQSIKQQGLLQPLVVRKIAESQYEIIAGERRWRASKLAGLKTIPVIVKQVDDETAMAMALVENLQREDLNPMDQARAMERLTQEFELTHQQVAELLSKSRAQVSNYLRLLNLNDDVKKHLEYGSLDMGHARALLTLTPELQSDAAKLIIAKQLSVRETEKLVERLKTATPSTPEKIQTIADNLQIRINTLAKSINMPIKIKAGVGGKGQLVIHYHNTDMVERLLGHLAGLSVN